MSYQNNMSKDMTANNLTPYIATHPGEVLKDELEFRGISQRQFSKQLGISYSLLNEVLNGKRPVNTELALLIEAALGIDAEPLLNMQTRYNLQKAKENSSFFERLKSIGKVAAMFSL